MFNSKHHGVHQRRFILYLEVAMLGMSKVLREELKPHHVRVTSILPGATLTNSWAGVELPAERFIAPDDIAQVVWTAYNLPDSTVLEEILLRPMLGDL